MSSFQVQGKLLYLLERQRELRFLRRMHLAEWFEQMALFKLKYIYPNWHILFFETVVSGRIHGWRSWLGVQWGKHSADYGIWTHDLLITGTAAWLADPHSLCRNVFLSHSFNPEHRQWCCYIKRVDPRDEFLSLTRKKSSVLGLLNLLVLRMVHWVDSEVVLVLFWYEDVRL